MTEDFTHRAYTKLIQNLKTLGYHAVSYGNCSGSDGELLLRHDIDMSIPAALPIAEIEAEENMKAHYFVLLRSELYNPFTPSGRAGLARLIDLGHFVGLHLDASIYGNDFEALELAAKRECGILEQMIGVTVTTISFHRPARALIGRKVELGGRRHTYEPQFYTDMAYVSDSRGEWRYGHPLDQAAVSKARPLQLLTHPIWWREGPQLTALETLDRFVDDRYKTLKEELAANCEPYQSRVNSKGNLPKP